MIRPVIATTRNIRTAESVNVAATTDSGSEPADETSSWARPLVTMTTVPSAAVLISAFVVSHSPCVPNIRLMPGKGLSFFSVGFIDFVETVTPPWAAAATVPTTIIPTPIGSTVVRNALSAWPMRADSAVVSGCEATTPTWTNIFWTASNELLTSDGSSTLAAATPSHVPSSRVRGICPSLRAFFRRWGVGFSVFSPPGPSLAMHHGHGSAAPQGQHRAGRVLHQRVERRWEQREGEAEHRQRQHDLDGEADLEDVERRRGPAQQRQGDVGEQQDGDHRAGDLQGGQEHHREGLQHHRGQLIGRHVAADRQSDVGRREALDDEQVAAAGEQQGDGQQVVQPADRRV